MVKLEIGAGQRPTPGYVATDITAHDGVAGVAAQDIDLPDDSLEEVLALGMVEHLTYSQARATFANVHRMLIPGGTFLFDVPDFPVWCQYLIDAANDRPTPFSHEHILMTIYGWQRWPGDEHRSGWTRAMLDKELVDFPDVDIRRDATEFLMRGHDRRRFHRLEDAHLYVVAVK